MVWPRSALAAVSRATIALFFIQLLTAFVAANYAVGLLHNRLPPEAATVAFFFSPLLLLLPISWPKRTTHVLASVIVLTRLTYPLLGSARLTLLVAGCGVGAALLLIPLLIRSWSSSPGIALFGPDVALAVLGSIALRSLGSGVDISTIGTAQLVAWPLGLATVAGWRPHDDASARAPDASFTPRIAISCCGLQASLALVYLAFAAPNVVSRWTGQNYLAVVALAAMSLSGWWLVLQHRATRSFLTGPRMAAATAVFAVLLLLTILTNQVAFPANASGYPIPEPPVSVLSRTVLVLMLILWPVLVLDLDRVAAQIGLAKPSSKALGAGFAVANGFLAVVIFSKILTTTYDYVPVVGPALRDRFWFVMAAPAVVVVLAVTSGLRTSFTLPRPALGLSLGALGVAILAIGGAAWVRAEPHGREARALTFVTFNVQQGYSSANQRNFEGQLALLRRLEPDVVGLQESDTARAAGGNDDLVRYLSDGLDMYSYYGPKTVTGTFGLALLSRYPLRNTSTFYLYSTGEQTAVISAEMMVGDMTFHVLVTHLGNGGPLEQQREVLELASRHRDLVLLGDFNFRPDSRQYAMTVAGLEDAWSERWPSDKQADGSSFPRRIDYVFVSVGTAVADAAYVESTASDHLPLLVRITW